MRLKKDDAKMSESGKRVLIAGGGITCLSAAYELKKRFTERGEQVRITLVEQEDRFGGKIATLRKDGFVIESGPDSFLARKKAILDVTKELGLESELIATRPEAKKTYIFRKQKLCPIPPGLVMGIPSRLLPFLTSGLISPFGKARAAMDLILPCRQADGDESIGQFIERRFGREMLDRVVQPLLAGIYSGDCRTLSLQATFPHLQEIERKHRSLILGIMKGVGQAYTATSPSSSSTGLPEHVKGSLFLSYRNGLYTIVEKLLEQLSDAEQVTGAKIVKLEVRQEEGRIWYRTISSNGREFAADAVILALPAYALAHVFPRLASIRSLGRMPYVSVANVVLGFKREQIVHPLDGSGFVIPPCEGRFVTACTWTSSKWSHTSREGHVLLRCYVGRTGDEEWMGMDDDEIIESVMHELSETIGVRAQPIIAEVNRHLKAMPQYEVGHLARVARIHEVLSERYPGVFAAGAAFHGIGLPDCVRQGKEAAEQVMNYLLYSDK
ncbi:protoporphyrinogen oxidase [Brevibacillus humidisoli]|uniref:protoporphyrinogen oxidase n=1 Tax=Brevibacillus humidisoli TaxID=2895522 RepID=UPI001E3C7EC4|nr:protoporphyrinogen oxidase [Brevibacillus humidisoli]UFJ41756.1 protoporphyrinogen oxidase [Brevibacillus humidisoli]